MFRKQWDELQDTVGALLWVLLVLVAGAVLLIAAAVTLAVSERPGLGIWGALVVGAVALAVGAAVLIRSRRRKSDVSQQRSAVSVPAVGARGAAVGSSSPRKGEMSRGRTGGPSASGSAVTLTPIPPRL